MSASLTLVDAFTSRPFAGNPAAVCVVDAPPDETWMRQVARELGMPATVFVRADGDRHHLRWFTPTSELKLCGHGTLSAAHVLWESGALPCGQTATFQTNDGTLTAIRRDGCRDGCRDVWIELNFPAIPATDAPPPAGLVEALAVRPVYVGRSRLDYLVEVEGEDDVRRLQPDFQRLREVQTRGVIVTSRSATTDRDFVSRFFAPSTGLNEDHVTGSAHCCLTPYWATRLGKPQLVAHQISSRGGVLHVTLDGDRVRLAGQAVTVARGELTIV